MNATRAQLVVWFSILTLAGCGDRSDLARVEAPNFAADRNPAHVVTIDHQVSYTSTVAANAGELVQLFVRERYPDNRDPRHAVLMIHGRSIPALAAFDLDKNGYDWALWLAQTGGLDVFILDFQGSGRSPRPMMADPCNVPTAQQRSILIPNPLSATCPPSYPFQLIDSRSDWDELDAVVDYIRALRGVDKVALVSWSQGSFRVGPYAVLHPDKVESLLLYAPIFNPNFRSGAGSEGLDPPVTLPQAGTPMSLSTRGDLMAFWNVEIKCEGQREEGIEDVVWSAAMENDPIGRTWGPPEGVLRVRTPFLWGWNAATAHRISVPVLMIRGEFDNGDGGIQDLARLYAEIPHDHKMWFTVGCAGHRMVWERQRRVLHHISKEWLTHVAVDEQTSGKFFVDIEGNIYPIPE